MGSWSARAPVYQRAGTATPREPRTQAAAAMSPEVQAWLKEFLADCAKSPRLSRWERDFVFNVGRRFDWFTSWLVITPKQMGILRRIEVKIHAVG